MEVELYTEIDPKESKYKHTDRHTFAILRKAKAQKDYWPRLTKEEARIFSIRTDFDKWVDQDEQDKPQSSDPMEADDMSSFGGLEALPGMPEMDGLDGQDLGN